VDERSDRAVDVLDGRRQALAARRRKLEGRTLDVDVPSPLGEPVGELERRVAQRAAERVLRVLSRRRLRHLDEQAADAGTGEARLEHAKQEEERHRRERGDEQQVERARPVPADRPDDDVADEERARDEAGEQDRCEHAPLGRRRPMPAARGEDDDGAEHDDRGAVDEDVQRDVGRVAVRDQRRVRRRALDGQRLGVEEQREQRPQAGENVAHADGEPLRAARQRSRRVGQQEVDEHRGPERADGEPDRERHRAVRPPEGAGEPGEADADHQPADRVLRRTRSGDEA
jgi:hypothetical protein